MNNDEKLVSVILPTYNRANFIQESIQGVLDQTYPHWELIVVDDGSSDDTRAVVKRLSDSRISFRFNPHCGALGKVRNAGIRAAAGEYVAFLDSDDVWLPHKLEFQVRLLAEHPEAHFIFGHGEQFGAGAIPPPSLEPFFLGNAFLPLLVQRRFVFYVPTFVFRRELVDSVGFIDEALISACDIDFFLRIAQANVGIFSNEIVARIRKHGQRSERLEILSCDEYVGVLDRFRTEGFLTRRQHAALASAQFYRLGLLHMDRERPVEAIRSFSRFVRLNPFNYRGWGRLAQSALKRWPG